MIRYMKDGASRRANWPAVSLPVFSPDQITGEKRWRADEILQMMSSPPSKTSGHSQRRPSMNSYGRQAREMWQQLAPRAYAEIPDPNHHFSMIGEQAANRIASLSVELAGPDKPGESYWGKVARLETAKRQAEEIVRDELLMPPSEPEVEQAQIALEDQDNDLSDVMELMTLGQQITNVRAGLAMDSDEDQPLS